MSSRTEASVSLGLYNQDLYLFLPIDYVSTTPFALPFTLTATLSDPNITHIPLTYQTVVFNGDFLLGSGFASVNVLFHFYLFHTVKQGDEHRSFCPTAVYTFEGAYSSFSIKAKHADDFLRVNPESILKPECRTEVYMHPRDQDMCCSPNNAKVQFSKEVPVVVFYTLCLVPYGGSLVRGNVTRHVVLLDSEAGLSREVLQIVHNGHQPDGLWKELSVTLSEQDASLQLLTSILRSNSSESTLLSQSLLFFLTWQVSGCPNQPDFGSLHYLSHSTDSSYQSTAWVTRLVDTCVLDLVRYLRYL